MFKASKKLEGPIGKGERCKRNILRDFDFVEIIKQAQLRPTSSKDRYHLKDGIFIACVTFVYYTS